MSFIKLSALVFVQYLFFSGLPPGRGDVNQTTSKIKITSFTTGTPVATEPVIPQSSYEQIHLQPSEDSEEIDIPSSLNIRRKIPPVPGIEPKNVAHKLTNSSNEPRLSHPTIKTTKPDSVNQNIRKTIPRPSLTLSPKDDPETTQSFPDLPVPVLPPNYEVSLEVSDMFDNENFGVTEKERDGKARHALKAGRLNVTCIFNSLTAEGYLVEGVKCGRYSGLPQKCFCTSKFCRPYVAVGALLEFLRSNKATLSKQTLGGEGGLEFWAWRISMPEMSIEAVYSTSKRPPSAPVSSLPPSYDQLTPISFSVKGSGRIFMLPGGAIWLQYRVVGWSLDTDSPYELVATPPGVFCPAHERKFLPKVSNHFSLTMETIIENLATIAYERQHYEAEEKLVSFTYRPHLHAEGVFLLNIPGLTDLSLESYRVVHDFKTGIQYMINEKTCNCSIQGIPITALDAAPTDSQHIRLRHASELISIDPNMFIYKGQRRVRGVNCDVWVAERGVTKGRYSTVEVFFSHENWTVEVEVFNKVRQVPIGISTYVADADSPGRWTSIVHTFFYEYTDGHPSWDEFDISPCLSRINRVFLLLTLEVSYSELVHYNLEMAKNSIRRAVAGIAGVSPLRISDLFLSSRPETGEVDVWFVLLEKPDLTGPVLTPRAQLLMADAYQLLHDITHKHNVSVKLDLSPSKKLFVIIKRGSLETSSEALHPRLRHKSLRFLKAGYTAGSMAGLGFSMAILGTCVGVFVGFLLWKRSSSVPYQVTD
ncbi:UNVERIFIED_CONTAM: hypothetical protein RMT77_001516 [Armadillidium vulgare]